MREEFVLDHEFMKLFEYCDQETELAFTDRLLSEGGPRDPLKIWLDPSDGRLKLIDGYRRHRICTRNNLPYQTERVEGLPDRESVIVWMRREQIDRRNLTPGDVRRQRALIAQSRLGMIPDRSVAKKDKKEKTPGVNKAIKEVAAELGVSTRTIRRDLQEEKYLALIDPEIGRWMVANDMVRMDFELMSVKSMEDQREIFASANYVAADLSIAIRRASVDYIASKATTPKTAEFMEEGLDDRPLVVPPTSRLLNIANYDDARQVISIIEQLETTLCHASSMISRLDRWVGMETCYRDLNRNATKLYESLRGYLQDAARYHDAYADDLGKAHYKPRRKTGGFIAAGGRS